MTPPLLREHRLRDIRSSTGSPPPPPLRDADEKQQNLQLQLPWRLLAESLALAAASTDAALVATTATGARALSAASGLAAGFVVHPLRSTVTQVCASSFGAAGAASALLEVSARLAFSASDAVADMLLPLSFVWNQIAACVRLAGVLLTYLGWSGLWLIQAVRLMAYSVLLLPGFARVGLFYFTSERVARGVRYGPRPRNTADLYVPPGCGFSAAELAAAATAAVARATLLAAAGDPRDRKKSTGSSSSSPYEVPAPFAASLSSPARPVVVYVTGGAWLIGHRAWGSLLAARLSAAAGAVVLCLDYRNFPQASAGGAAEDVGAGIGWAVAASDVLSGAPKRERWGSGGKRGRDKKNSGATNKGGGGGVVVVGQSAGAHLAALAILSRCAASEGVALPCVSREAASRMMSAAAAADALSPSAGSPGGSGGASAPSSAAPSPRSPSSSVDVEVDATDNVILLSAPPAAPPPSSRPGSSPAATARSEGAKPPSLQRHPSLSLNNPLHLPSLADAAATLGACDPAFGCFPPPVDPPEWVPSFAPSAVGGRGGGGGDVAAFVGVSGVYDVASLAPHLARRGLRPRLLERIMSLPVAPAAAAATSAGGEEAAATANGGGGEGAGKAGAAARAAVPSWRPALAELSPTVLLLDCIRRRREDEDASAYLSASPLPLTYWPARLPPTALLHGTADACAPASDAARFVEAARAAGAPEVSLRLYDGETHTSPLIENPMRGWGRDALGADLAALVVNAAAAAAAASSSAAAAARGGAGNDGGNNGGKRRNASSPSSAAAAVSGNAATTTSATLLRTSSSSSVLPAPPKSVGRQRRLGAVDGGGALCPGPLVAAAAAVCPF